MLVKWRSTSLCLLLFIITFYYFNHAKSAAFSNGNGSAKLYPAKETLKSLFLTEEQCDATFPDLTKEIDIAVARGPFHLQKGPKNAHGAVEGRIRDGKLYIISAEQDNVLKVRTSSESSTASHSLQAHRSNPPFPPPSNNHLSHPRPRHRILTQHQRHPTG